MVATNGNELELAEWLKVIENMIAEGRHGQESWGWSFVLWGVAYCIATAWATWGHSNLAWPVTMIAAGVMTGVIASRMSHGHPETTLGRALGAVWMSMGISLMVVLVCLAASGRYDAHVFVAIVGAMLATAHGTSAIILKWKMQFASRAGVAGGLRHCVLWFGHCGGGRIFCGYVFRADFIWDLRDDSGVAEAQEARGGPCLELPEPESCDSREAALGAAVCCCRQSKRRSLRGCVGRLRWRDGREPWGANC